MKIISANTYNKIVQEANASSATKRGCRNREKEFNNVIISRIRVLPDTDTLPIDTRYDIAYVRRVNLGTVKWPDMMASVYLERVFDDYTVRETDKSYIVTAGRYHRCVISKANVLCFVVPEVQHE